MTTGPVARYVSPLSLRAVVRALSPASGHIQSLKILPEQPMLFTASAADALRLHLLASGKGSVVMPAYTCIRVVEAVRAAGWIPRYVDIVSDGTAMQETALQQLLSTLPAPVVLLATHLFGIPSPMDQMQRIAAEAGAALVEDCAMAQGALYRGEPVGGLGHTAIFSFGTGKVLGLGAGGALVGGTAVRVFLPGERRDIVMARILSRAGFLGACRYRLQEAMKRLLGIRGTGSLSDPYCPRSISERTERRLHRLLANKCLEQELRERRDRGRRWIAFVEGLGSQRLRVLGPLDGDTACPPGLPLLCSDRDGARESLREIGVDCATYFDYVAARLDGETAAFPNSERLAATILLLPMHAGIDGVAHRVKQVLRRLAMTPCVVDAD